MFCRKCGNRLSEGAAFCPSCGTKLASGATAQQTPDNIAPSASEGKQVSQQVPIISAATPAKTRGIRSVFCIGRNIVGLMLPPFAILLALFSFFGFVGVIIAGVVIGILVLAGWSMSVAEKRQEEDKTK